MILPHLLLSDETNLSTISPPFPFFEYMITNVSIAWCRFLGVTKYCGEQFMDVNISFKNNSCTCPIILVGNSLLELSECNE